MTQALEIRGIGPAGGRAAGNALPLQAGLGFRLGRVTRALRRNWAEELSCLELSPPEAAALRGVNESPGCSLRALARTLGADPMNAKRCVDALERRGILRSGGHSGDRRSRTLTLSEEGRDLAHQVDDLVRKQEDWLEARIDPVDRESLEGALAKLETELGLLVHDVGPVSSDRLAHPTSKRAPRRLPLPSTEAAPSKETT